MRRYGLRPRASGYLTLAALGILIVAELAGVAYRQHQLGHARSVAISSPTSTATTGQPSTTSQSATTATSPPVQSSASGSATSITTLPATASPPTTTVVSKPGIVAYTLPSAAQVQVTFNSVTWLEAKSSPSGTVLYAGTLSAGASKTFATPVWIRFGNSQAASASIHGVALKMPPPGPGDLQVTAASQ